MCAKTSTKKTMEHEDKYGYKTSKGTALKFREQDIDDIILKLYAVNKIKDKQWMKIIWNRKLKDEENDFNNFTFVVRDKCNKIIGLIGLHTKDKRKFKVEVWIPNESKRVRYFDHVVESFLEWANNYTEINEIEMLIDVKDPYSAENDVIKQNIVFYAA